MKNMPRSLVFLILEKLKEVSVGSAELLEVILESPYGTSLSGFEYNLRKKQSARQQREDREKEEKLLQQRYYSLVYKLEKGGLLKRTKKGPRNKILEITQNGLKKLIHLRKKKLSQLPPGTYPKGNVNTFVIIAFDIPEKERRKRAWLRSVLKNLGLRIIQKSVWLGKVKIPEDFLEDLRDLKLTTFVEIFEITKTGSLEHIE